MRRQLKLSLEPLAVSILLMLSSCEPQSQTIRISFDVLHNGAAISCLPGSHGASISDLRFYVHKVAARNLSGEWRDLSLVADQIWQSEEVALIDFENGRDSCANGTEITNTVISGTLPTDDYSGLRFRIGVPEALNHADPMLAAAPLDRTAMHWHWRSGYKFIRTGVIADDDEFWLHLGSNRCRGTIGNIQGCDGTNTVTVELADFDPHADRVVLDIGRLTEGVDLDDGQKSSCSSGPDEQSCHAPFESLGLNFASGNSITPAKIFYGVRRQ